jgi:hypothetical protein
MYLKLVCKDRILGDRNDRLADIYHFNLVDKTKNYLLLLRNELHR